MDGSDTPGRRPTIWVTTHQSPPPPPTHRVAENPTLRRARYEWMTARDRADDGTARRHPTVRPFLLTLRLMATSHRSVHPPAPVRGKIHASHDRPRDRGRGGRARGDRPIDRPVLGRGARGGARGGGRPDVASTSSDARREATRARARDEEDVRARSRDDGRGRSRGGVGRRRENDGIGASETDAMRRPRAMIAARVCVGGSARWGNASTRANAGAR